MKEEIKTIYYPVNIDAIIIEFYDGKQVGLSGIVAGIFKENYCDKLNNIKRAPVLIKELTKNINFPPNGIFNIDETGNGYILYTISEEGQEKDFEITISPNELKTILQCG